jgi:integrase
MAKPYLVGKSWAFRLRIQGQDIYRSRFPSEAAARKEMNHLRAEIENTDKASGLGPFQTTLAVALTDYARQRLPYLKSAEQEARRINTYLRTQSLPIILLEKLEHPVEAGMKGFRHFNIYFMEEKERNIVNSLKAHRAEQAKDSIDVTRQRKLLAGTFVADVSMRDVQKLVDAMRDAGTSPATIHLERAVLRQLFNHAKQKWNWTRPFSNPAAKGLDMPKVNNARDKVLFQRDWEKLHDHLKHYGNKYVFPLVCLLLETAMRIGEPLLYAQWSDIDWEQHVLSLRDGKTGKRDVPLSPNAIRLLEQLKAEDDAYSPTGRIFNTTYEAIKKAWSEACKKAGISGIHIHDLRHTSATRYAIEFNGNLPYLKVITGHKTDAMLHRYINLKAEHVALAMHKEEIPPELAPAGYLGTLFGSESAQTADASKVELPANVIQVAFGRKAA